MAKEKLEDRILDCARCGITFLWSHEEQKQDSIGVDADASVPRLCPGCRQILPVSGRERGMVKWYNQRKHYGFIVCSDRPELFFHRDQVGGRRRLRPDDLVEFSVGEGRKGPVAVDVELVERPG